MVKIKDWAIFVKKIKKYIAKKSVGNVLTTWSTG